MFESADRDNKPVRCKALPLRSGPSSPVACPDRNRPPGLPAHCSLQRRNIVESPLRRIFVGRVNGGGPGHFGDEPGLPGLTKSPHSPVFDSGSALRNPWAEGFWPEGSARIESTRGGEWFIPDVVRQRDAPSRDHLGGRLVLQSILCPSCGSVGARVEHPMSTEGSIREADLLHCLECDYLWTLAIPQYPETG